jgi:hypothetical protein
MVIAGAAESGRGIGPEQAKHRVAHGFGKPMAALP